MNDSDSAWQALESSFEILVDERMEFARCEHIPHQDLWIAEDGLLPLLLWAQGKTQAEALGRLRGLLQRFLAQAERQVADA